QTFRIFWRDHDKFVRRAHNRWFANASENSAEPIFSSTARRFLFGSVVVVADPRILVVDYVWNLKSPFPQRSEYQCWKHGRGEKNQVELRFSSEKLIPFHPKKNQRTQREASEAHKAS